METLTAILLWLHVALGSLGLVMYWIPVVAKKGGRVHVRFGRAFVWCAYGVVATALLLSALRLASPPSGAPRAVYLFLAYIAIATLGFTRQAVLVVRTRRDPDALVKDRGHHALGWLCLLASASMIALGLLGEPNTRILLVAMSPIGVVAGMGILGFRRNPRSTPKAWWYAHMVGILGAGIAFHTAFLVFGAASFMPLKGPAQLIPWLAPTAIGVPAMILWVRHYQQRFGE